MTAYFIRRFLLMIPTFIGITLVVFTITRFVPGGPIERMISAAQQMSSETGGSAQSASDNGAPLSDDQIKELEKYYGFDKPILVSYGIWLGKVLRFDLGLSTRYNEPVWDIIKTRFPISISYGLITLITVYLVCIPLGIKKAIKHKTSFDNISSIVVFVGYAVPGYIVGIGAIMILASKMELFPLGGFISDDWEDFTFAEQIIDFCHHAALPLLAYLTPSFARLTFLMKNSMMDNLSADYIRTAIAKGLPFKKAVVKHALRNSLIPIATSFGNTISVVISGSLLVEKIFDINGFGLLQYESIVERDYPVVLGTLVISSVLFLVGNILSDICVAVVDPRIQFK